MAAAGDIAQGGVNGVAIAYGAAQEGAITGELCHEPVRRRVVNVIGRIPLLQVALLHDADPVGQRKGFFLVVGHQQGGDLFLTQDVSQFLGQRPTQIQVQAGKRLVQQ